VGEVGTVTEKIDPEGMVFVHGEHWRARANEAIEPDEEVEVVGIRGLVLKVRRSSPRGF
jgi:membrane-bound serine protease (ClpP class)